MIGNCIRVDGGVVFGRIVKIYLQYICTINRTTNAESLKQISHSRVNVTDVIAGVRAAFGCSAGGGMGVLDLRLAWLHIL